MYNVEGSGDWWTGKDMEASRFGVIDIIIENLGGEENSR
jgi:hypothetical protein